MFFAATSYVVIIISTVIYSNRMTFVFSMQILGLVLYILLRNHVFREGLVGFSVHIFHLEHFFIFIFSPSNVNIPRKLVVNRGLY